MKVKLIGFFSSVVGAALILAFFRWVSWIDNRSFVIIAIAVPQVMFLDTTCRRLWAKHKSQHRRFTEEPQKPSYSSLELSGYLTIDAFHWLKQKTEQLFQGTKEKN
ncbi:hypothetical protein [Faecalispora jeddahensis]|uniref:hypothetical protein n=1 Tax=Faecalispora jeddahensis TaxID=1414721 RepID=UPI001896E940|nr:hypothetical protein [Faecalispora jeddahensis]